jgi:membrane fusion protein (multidrug efflux system)
VAEGALIATLQDSLLQAELRKATAQQQQAQQDLQRLARLAERKLSSDDELGRARTALQVAEAEQNLLQTRLEHTRIRAPFAGLISERPMEPGDVAPKHAHLLTLIDPDSLIAEADASELLLPNLKKGDKVEIRIDALRRAPYPGHILRIHPHINPLTRLGRIEVAFEKAPPQAKAGQMAHLTFTIPARERLLVPFSALQRDRSGEFLYRLHTGKAQRQRVVSGIRIGELVEIEDGVQTGDRVVIRGFMGLRDGKAISDSRDREQDHAKP